MPEPMLSIVVTAMTKPYLPVHVPSTSVYNFCPTVSINCGPKYFGCNKISCSNDIYKIVNRETRLGFAVLQKSFQSIRRGEKTKQQIHLTTYMVEHFCGNFSISMSNGKRFIYNWMWHANNTFDSALSEETNKYEFVYKKALGLVTSIQNTDARTNRNDILFAMKLSIIVVAIWV